MNNEPQKKKKVVIKHKRNQSSPHQNADATTTMQFSRKFDWILLVEGSNDVKFYSKFALTFRKIDEDEIKNDFTNETDELIKNNKKSNKLKKN